MQKTMAKERLEKSIKNQELKAEAIATQDMIPYISNEWTRDIKSAEADIAIHEKEKPTPIVELKTLGDKLMSKIQVFRDDTGKEHKKHDDYVRAQTAIIQRWKKMREMKQRKEAELRNEQNLIIKTKTQNPDYNELLKLSRYEKNHRPDIFESIMKKEKILLYTHPMFDEYRVFKKAFEQAREARAETKRGERGQKRG
jgi:hypothetical protein